MKRVRIFGTDRSRLDFELVTGLQTAQDWPNSDFLEAIHFFLKIRADSPESEDWNFLVVIDQSQVVGGIGAKGPISKVGEIEVGYGIAPSFWGNGLATFALGEFVRMALQKSEIKAVVAECLVSNVASIRVLERCRFRRVGKRPSDEGELFTWRLASCPENFRLGIRVSF